MAMIEQAVVDGCDVINLSLGGFGGVFGPMDEALLNADGAGVVAVAAAGNDGQSGREFLCSCRMRGVW